MNDNDDDLVAIVGVGCRLPGNSNSPNEFWETIKNKKDGIIEMSERFSDNFFISNQFGLKRAGLISMNEWKSFDPIFFGISPSEALTIDPSQRLLLKCTWEAFEDASIDPLSIRGTSATVYVGTSTPEYQYSTVSNYEPIKNLFGATPHSLANRISYCFDLRGQSLSIDTGCSSSLNAAVLGYNSIKDGQCDISVVGGYNFLMDPFFTKGLCQLEMLSKSGKSCAFDSSADGYVRGEGCGVVVFKRLKAAIRDSNRIYCVIEGANSNVDGYYNKNTFYAPSIPSQVENIIKTFKSAKRSIKPKDVSFFECHGTSTLVGDPIETEALSRVFKENHSPDSPLLIGSIKPNIGHLEGGSGIASLIKCCLMFKFKKFAPNINFENPNPKIKFDEWNLKVNTQVLPFPNKNTTIMMNNFGVTGSNACLLLSQYNHSQNKDDLYADSGIKNKKEYLIPFSANSKKSLRNYQISIVNNINHYKNNSNLFDFIKCQINSRSNKLLQRSMGKAKNWDDIAKIDNYIDTSHSKVSNITVSKRQPQNIVFIFPGQGTQYIKMGSSLYQTNQTFKLWVDKIDSKLEKYFGFSIWKKINSFSESDKETMNEPIIAQPSISMIQVALFHIYIRWNINPSFIIGHSLGETSAQFCSGNIDLETFCSILYNRSVSQQKTVGLGRMLSINIGEKEFKEKYSYKYPSLEISCYNSPNSIVVSGIETVLFNLKSDLKNDNIFSILLSTRSSFHSSSQETIKEDILNCKFKTQLRPTIPVFSTVYKKIFGPTLAYDPKYCFENIRMPVLFAETIEAFYQHIETNSLSNEIVFIEISPHPTLLYYLKEMVPKDSNYFTDESIIILSSLNKKNNSNDQTEINNTISKLYCFGYNNLNFNQQFEQITINKHVDLPFYKWEDEKYFLEDHQHYLNRTQGPPIDLLGTENLSPIKSFTTYIDVKKPIFQYLKGHAVNGGFNFPGFGYVDNVINMYAENDLIIDGIEFKDPLIFKAGENTILHTNATQVLKNQLKVHFHYYNNKSDKWIETSNVNVYLVDHDYDNKELKMDIDQLKKECNHYSVTTDDLYNFIKSKTGVRYSENFIGVKECYYGDNKCLSFIPINLPNTNLGIPNSIINVTTLDSCLHGLLGLIKDPCQLFLDRLENFKYFSRNIPSIGEVDHVYSYGELNFIYNNSYYVTFKVLLPDGTILVEVDNIILTSSIEIKDSLNIEYEPNFYYEYYLESIESSVPTPSHFKDLINSLPTMDKNEIKYYEKYIINALLNNVNEKTNIDLDIVQKLSIQELENKYLNEKKNQKLFNFIFNLIKENIDSIEKNRDNVNQRVEDKSMSLNSIINASLQIILINLFPSGNHNLMIEFPESRYYSGWLNYFYENNTNINNLDKLVVEIIKKSIIKQANKKYVVRILEIGGGIGSLSEKVVNGLNTIIEANPNIETDIEYTYSHESPSHFVQVKQKLKHFNGNVLFKVLKLQDDSVENQNFKPNYYDFIIASNTLHLVKEIKPAINQIYRLLKPNGQLLFLEFSQQSLLANTVFGFFDEWWSFKDIGLRSENCLLTQGQWESILSNTKFTDTIMTTEDNSFSYLIQTRKEFQYNSNVKSSSEVIIFTFDRENRSSQSNEIIKQIYEKYSGAIIVGDLDELLSKLSNTSKVYFIKTIEELNLENFKTVTLEYIKINQHMIKNNLTTKIILVTIKSFEESNNYLNSSVNGTFRYFCEDQEQLVLYCFDLDCIDSCCIDLIDSLSNENNFIQTEFIVRKQKVYIEKMKRIKNSINKYTSKQKTPNICKDSFICKYNFKLQMVLDNKEELKPGQVEVDVKAAGLDYKDYLIYKKKKILNNKFNTFGSEFSGTVKRVGINVKNFKVGDHVYGLKTNTTQTSIIINSDQISQIPNNISLVEAASVPSIYINSYYCLFNIGDLNILDNESILIHSSTNDFGLALLNILKWKEFSSQLFVTVNSDEKRDYLIQQYGSFISGIFSVNNFEKEIKANLMKSNKEGIDLIFNSISNEFMDSNCRLLSCGGKIIDTNINEIDNKEQLNLNLNLNGNYIKLNSISPKTAIKILRSITQAFNEGHLKPIPINKYSNINIKNALLEINKKNTIGKVIVEFDTDILQPLLTEKNNHKIIESTYKITSVGKTILVTGQTGIALEIIKWIIKFSNNIENIIILSKSKMKWELKSLIQSVTNDTKKNHIKFHFNSVDVGNKTELYNSIQQLYNEHPTMDKVDSIFHYAFVQVVNGPLEISMKDLDLSHGAKSNGAINLHTLSLDFNWPIKNFVMASSTAAKFGSFNQCSYVSSLCVIDALSRYRKSIGLPSISINMGSILSVGIAAKSDTILSMLESQGIHHINVNQLLGSMDIVLHNQTDISSFVVYNVHFDNVQIKKYTYPIIDYYLNPIQNKTIKENDPTNSNNKQDEKDKIINKICEILSLEPSKLNTSNSLYEYGIDSLASTNLRNWFSKEYYVNIVTVDQIQNLTIVNLVNQIKNYINKKK
ncbi:hypothetical protein DICPUDRAFT_54214 [Dictyostelium purpureum]|uniref:Uncharacterized protein n=1 Tax=Dictyostelium purpureum TaxID=5786 RepID=F0ZG26_DICPU|nr:uncharacterized protein DICPUDRAFT_54214 [Dictyostelium purpureum]EGC37083.1 hypothetical protein DICPUDRAFT_54214 [Dictyostelium purpureum]|eukprot:XP_003286364.1 hypothetical protein DICPUDRAFT_54214 [Dictyostelium purpureum]